MEQTVPLAWHEQTCARLRAVEQTLDLLLAVDDRDFKEGSARLAKALIRLTWGEGQTGIVVERQQDLCVPSHLSKTHLVAAVWDLVDAGVLLIHPESGLHEILPNFAGWKVRPRCHRGLEYAQLRHVDLVKADWRLRREQRELGEREESFQSEPTLRHLIGQNARDEFDASAGQPSVDQDVASSRPGADESEQATIPPGPIGTEPPAGPRSLKEAVRQVIESKGKVPSRGTSEPGGQAKPPPTQPKVPAEGTFQAKSSPGGNFPHAGVRSSADLASSGKTEVYLSSGNDPDDLRADERGRAGKEQITVERRDELLGDIERKLGRLSYQHDRFWRDAIAACRPAVAHALASIKYAQRGHPGGYMRTAFYNECADRKVRLPDHLEHRRPPVAKTEGRR